MRMSKTMLFLLLLALSVVVAAQQHITPAEAQNHIGQIATVCGRVASLHWATKSKGEPTFINLDRAYPNQIFTILIWGNDRPRFGNLEQDYMDKPLCVTGAISSYRGVPEIITRSPGSIKLGQ